MQEPGNTLTSRTPHAARGAFLRAPIIGTIRTFFSCQVAPKIIKRHTYALELVFTDRPRFQNLFLSLLISLASVLFLLLKKKPPPNSSFNRSSISSRSNPAAKPHITGILCNRHETPKTNMPSAEGAPRTLYDKVLQAHIVDEKLDGTLLLYIGTCPHPWDDTLLQNH